MGIDKGFLQFERIEPRHEPAEKRVRHFREFISTLTDEEALRQACRCMDCGIPFCSHYCPLKNLMPDIHEYVTQGDFGRAFAVLDSTSSFPEITGRICPALCEEACTLGLHRKPVGTRSIERKRAEYAFAHGLVRPVPAAQKTGLRVAVVGSGPAGLACAQQLARLGHTVTVYEKMDKAGGLLRYGIPDFKLPKEILDRRLDQLVREGVRFAASTLVTGGDAADGLEAGVHSDALHRVSVSKLAAENDAIVLTLGAEVPRDLRIPGRGLHGVYFALDFLIAQNRTTAAGCRNPIDVRDKNVVVIGGGETASDCIGTANRLGAASVTQLDYHDELPETADLTREWPGWRRIKRTSTSQEEGCERCFSTNTTAFDGAEKLRGVHTVRVAWGPGRKITPIEGTASYVQADVALIAMGYARPTHTLVSSLGLEVDARGSLRTPVQGPRAWRTSSRGVFAAGDGRSGQSLVVHAIAEGRGCAAAVDAWLRAGDPAW